MELLPLSGANPEEIKPTQPKKKLETWTKLIEDELGKPLHTDFQNYLQSISKRTQAGTGYNSDAAAIFMAMSDAGRDLWQMLTKIKQTEAALAHLGSGNPKTGATKQ